MDLGLTDECVLVTGVSRGIGLAIAEGAKVTICGRTQASLDQAREAA